MIRYVTVVNYLGEALIMPLSYPEASGIVVRDITGIGPGSASINTSEINTNDGSLYNSARLGQRNIILTLQFFDQSLTAEEIRHLTYKYFPIKKPITLFFETDERVCMIDGYVETNEPVIFSSGGNGASASTAEYTQISVICPYPYFYSAGADGEHTTVFFGIDPKFEFPFSNESLYENLIEFGEIQQMTEQVIEYYGDAEIGVEIHINSIGTVGNITIYNTGTREMMTIDVSKIEALTGEGIVAGDEIIINTVRGHKSIRLLRGGRYINILNALDKDADWFQLAHGENVFAYTATSGTSNLQFRIMNRVIFEGV